MAYKQKRNPFKKMSTMLAEGAGAAETPGRDFRAPTKKLTPLNKGIAKEKTFEEEEGKSQPMSIDVKTPDKELMAATGAGEATSEKITTDPPERDLENPPDPDREDGGYDAIIAGCEALGKNAELHVKNYGSGIEDRLTGDHETQKFDTFSYGVSDRGASIRIPWQVEGDKKGYLEDRRPNANADPYVIAMLMIDTVCSAASS